MTQRPLHLISLIAVALLAGCGGADEAYTEDDGAVPAGAIPAAPDVRPGAQSAPGNVQPRTAASDTAVQTPGATPAVPPDSAR